MAEITIHRLGHLGDGISHDPELGPIFAQLVLPGEVVTGEITGDRMVDPKIVTPSSDRVAPPCPHFKACGGCSLQHASDSFVADWKTEVVRKALVAHGLEAEMRPIQTSPPRSRRRATLAGTRTKKGALIGFHARKSDTIVPIRDCFLLDQSFLPLLPVLEELTRLGGSRNATLSFQITRAEAGFDLSVTGGKPLDGELLQNLPQFAAHFMRLTWEGEPVFADAPPYQRFGTAQVSPPAGAFLQATREGEAALLAAAAEAVGDAKQIVDLFSGCGTFTLPLAANAAVHAVETSAEMLAALDHGSRFATGHKAITTEARDLFRRPLLPDELRRYDAAVIDPPRAGAEAQTKMLAEAFVPRIAFISCNPVTFARDAKLLTEAGYRLNWVQVVDQFRWSPHVELAASFSLAHIDD